MAAARRAEVSASFDGTDVSAIVNDYLISLSFTDNEEDMADDLQIKLEDRAWMWVQQWLGNVIDGMRTTAKGVSILASIKAIETDGTEIVTDCGEFELDEVKASGPPSTVTIKGTSLGYSGIRKTENDKSWEKYTLSGIQGEIAGKYGLGTVYDCDYDPFYAHLEQAKQTDIAFLKKLCQDAGFSLKIANGKIVIFDQRKYEAQQEVAEIVFGNGGYTKWDFSTGESEVQYKQCIVRWTDTKTGKKIEGIAYANESDKKNAEEEKNSKKSSKKKSSSSSANEGTDEILVITNQEVTSQGEAESLAEHLLKLHNKMERVAVFTLPGSPVYCAGMTVRVKEAGYWSGKYLIKTAKHSVSTSGYTTTITLRKVDEIVEEVEEAKTEYNVGDIVYFKGGYHYRSSDRKNPTGGKRRAGPAVITHKTKLTRPHPYGLKGGHYAGQVDGDSNVHGWVDADSFS